MARFTKALRQKIVRDFALKNGGWFDPAAFLESIAKEGETHPAYEWFQWDDEAAAHEYRLDQARDFARGLVIRFEVEVIERGKLSIATREMPLAISPTDGRRSGGGYYITDPDDPEHMEEHCRQAASSLRWFVSRYSAALQHRGVNLRTLQNMIEKLSPAEEMEDEAA